MRLTRQSEIAIAILTACARRPADRVHTSAAAAEAGASRCHTAKIVHLLLQAGLLRAARGRRGGLCLAQPAESIPLGTVLRHTQPELIRAPEASRRRKPALTHLDMIVDMASATFTALIDRFTIADLTVRVPVHSIACADCRLLRARGTALTARPSHDSQEGPDRHAQQLDC